MFSRGTYSRCGMPECTGATVEVISIKWPRSGRLIPLARCAAHRWDDATLRRNAALLVGSVIRRRPVPSLLALV